MSEPPTPPSGDWKPPARPDLGPDGTHPPAPATYTTALLRDHGEALAAACTRRFYDTWPALLARYGERGRELTHQDQFWHLSTLDAALVAGSTLTFTAYVDWLRAFLAGRGMGDDISGANFVWLREAVAGLPGVDEAERAAVLAYLDAAVARFG